MGPMDDRVKSIDHPSFEENVSVNAIGNPKVISDAQNVRIPCKAVNHRITKRRIYGAVYAFLSFDFKHNLCFSSIDDIVSG
jgi:hypothetical protein